MKIIITFSNVLKNVFGESLEVERNKNGTEAQSVGMEVLET